MLTVTRMMRSQSRPTFTEVSHKVLCMLECPLICFAVVQSRGMAAQANAGPAAASRTPSPGSPPRRQVPEEDDNDPFTDSHAIETPATEMVEPRWP